MDGTNTRTNNLVESHNARLGRSISGKTNFYRFVLALAKEENRKSVQFMQLIGGRTGVYDEPVAKYRNRSEAIKTAQRKLADNVVTVQEFLAIITNTQNRSMVVDLASFECNSGLDDDEVDEETSVHSGDDAMLCVICSINRREVLLLPCNHFMICIGCFQPNIKCPQCCTITSSYKTFT